MSIVNQIRLTIDGNRLLCRAHEWGRQARRLLRRQDAGALARGHAGETLLHLRRLGRATLNELADAMGVARSTVGERVDRLIQHGLVTTVDLPINGRGRPATTFEFDPSGGRILTAQVGMTGVRLGVSDLAGRPGRHRLVDVAITEGVEIVPRRWSGASSSSWTRSACRRADRRRRRGPPRGGRAVVRRARPAGVGRALDRRPALGDLRRADVRRPWNVNLLALGQQHSRSGGRGVTAVREGRFGDRLWLRGRRPDHHRRRRPGGRDRAHPGTASRRPLRLRRARMPERRRRRRGDRRPPA